MEAEYENNQNQYELYNMQNNSFKNNSKRKKIKNIIKNNEQYEIYKTLEERINNLEKELNMQKMNFITNNNNYEIDNQNGLERIKKKKISKKNIKITNNIYDLPKEEPKTSNLKNRQKVNRLNRNAKNFNNQISQFNNNKVITNSNRKTSYNIKDKENKKRSITPLNSKLKKHFN